MTEIEMDGCLPFKRLDDAVAQDAISGDPVKPASVQVLGGLALDVNALDDAQYVALMNKLAELHIPLVGVCTAPYHPPRNPPDGPDEEAPPDDPDRREA